MELNHVIIHKLLKEQHKEIDLKKPYQLRKTVLNKNDDRVIDIVKRVSELYGTKYNSSTYGTFSENKNRRGKFPEQFYAYSNEDVSTELFYTLSKLVMDELTQESAKVLSSSGGYILFSDYTSRATRYFLIAMIKQKNDITITDSLDPEIFETIDLSKLHQAAKINFDSYNEYLKKKEQEQELYLSFISPVTNKTASGYFIDALGCRKGNTTQKMTKDLISISVSFFRNDEILKKNLSSFKNELYSYLFSCCNSKPKRSAKLFVVEIIIRDSMKSLYDEDILNEKVNTLMDRLNSDKVKISAEFNVSLPILNSYRKTEYKNDDYSFSFENSLLGSTKTADIYYDEKKGTLTFNRLNKSAKEVIEKTLSDTQNDSKIIENAKQ